MNRIVTRLQGCFSKEASKATKIEEVQRLLERYDFIGIKRLMADGGTSHKALRRIFKLK